MVDELKFVVPSEKHEKAAKDFLREHFKVGEDSIPGSGGLEKYNSYEEWVKAVKDASRGKNLKENYVPASTLFVVRVLDNKIIGIVDLRYELNDYALQGGHIGYDIRPSERRKGYATEIMKMILLFYKKRSLSKVLVVCKESNIVSRKVIKGAGGVLEKKVFSKRYGCVLERYWITLD